MRKTSQRAVQLPLSGLYTWREVIFIISFPSLLVEDNWWPSNGSIGFLDNSWPVICQMHIIAILRDHDQRGVVWYVMIIGSQVSSLIAEFPFAARSYKCCNTGSLWPLYQPCRPSSILCAYEPCSNLFQIFPSCHYQPSLDQRCLCAIDGIIYLHYHAL
jgi:hypothetical protein